MAEQRVTILIETKHKGKAKGKEAEEQTKKISRGVKDLGKITKQVSGKMGYQITFIAWHFRYLGNIMTRVGQQWQRVVKDAIETAATLQESFLSIEVAAAIYGQSAEEATRFTKELALTGLLPLQDAANSVKNLMITGLGYPEMEQFTRRYLDVAFLMTSGVDEMQKSLDFMTKSVLRGTKVLGTDITGVKLWIETNNRLKKTMGITLKDLSARRRALEILKTIEDKYAATVGLHEIEQDTLRAMINKVVTSITLLKDAYGRALAPVLKVISDYVRDLTQSLVDLIDRISPTIAIVTVLGLAITTLTGSLFMAVGVILSVVKILDFFKFGVIKLSLGFLGLNALLIYGTYLILKKVGAWDKMKASMSGISDRIQDIRDSMENLGKTEEEGIEIDEDKRIAHERRVADLEEDLERETSKGLWTNQMAIKDLEKRLKREDEDWSHYLEKQGKAQEEGGEASASIFEQMSQGAQDAAEEIGKIDFWATFKEETKKLWEWLRTPETWTNIGETIVKYLKIGFLKIFDLAKWISDSIKKIDFIKIGETITKWIKIGIQKIFDLSKWVNNILKKVEWGKIGEEITKWIKIGFEKIFDLSKWVTDTLHSIEWKKIGNLIGNWIGIGIIAVFALAKWIWDTLPEQDFKRLGKTIGLWIGTAIATVLEFGYGVFEGIIGTFTNLFREGGEESIEAFFEAWYKSAQRLKEIFSGFFGGIGEGIVESLQEPIINYFKWLKDWLPFGLGERIYIPPKLQFGGIVPGPIGQPIPIIAHGGERVIPSRDRGGGGNTTINFYGATVREDADLDRIAQKVNAILGQQQRLKRLGG